MAQLYVGHRAQLASVEIEYAKSLDHWLLTLCAGALALSATFVQNLIGRSPHEHGWLLLLAWNSLLVALACVLRCIHLTQRSHRVAIEILDQEAGKGPDDLPRRFAARLEAENHAAKPINYLNGLAYCLFVLGIATLALFAFVNLE